MVDEGFSLLKELSRSGYADAMYTLGTAYLDDKKDQLGYNQLMQAAKRSHPGACYMMGRCAERGRGTKKSSRLALEFYTKAATAGYKPALYRMGLAELKGELGLRKDPKKAVTWLRRAAAVADKDHPQPLLQLCLLYETGVPPHIKPDDNYARDLLIEAANLEYGPAQYKLGCCYEFGKLGCPVDLRESILWYMKAAKNNDADAQFALAGWYLKGLPGVLELNDHAAYTWTYKAATQDHPKAQYAVGYFCEKGIGCTVNLPKAQRWYAIAERSGAASMAAAATRKDRAPRKSFSGGRAETNSVASSSSSGSGGTSSGSSSSAAKNGGLFSFLRK
ncbi:hypothetical protein BC832DRAFT_530668 [Gaertneriomyces semiglobifer]|nr:hypothetical protein BC832DRAFT_530668 [Gaertneriomyces semiglobifer]